MTDHRIGQQLGEYTLTARVGWKYRGEHVRSGTPVTVSVFEGATFDGELARTLAGIRHPNVATVLDVGMADGAVYVVSELVEGAPLAERWQARVAVPEVVAHAREILRGLAAIHAHRIVHRNLRPSNIVVTDAAIARVVLVDVGIDAMISRPERDDSVERPAGQTRYLAPELARADEAVDGRADIYALGVMMYEALAGKPLFEGDELQVLQSHLKKRFARLPFDVPRPLRSIVYKALSKEPADRFEDAEDMRAALASRRASSGRSWSLPLAAGVLVAGAAGVVIGIRSCDSEPATQTSPAPISTPAGGTPAPSFKAPPPAPGDPPLRPDQEQMLDRFAANISQGIYDTPSLTFLLCNSQLGLSQLRHATDPAVAALMRRMVAMFRAAPGMANVTCPAGPVPLPVPSPPAPSP